jgi:two-component system, OmpR family, sensor histidine kinase BaeS
VRSLSLKLTLAFLLVGLAGAGLVALVVRQYTQQEFNQLVLDQNQQALVGSLLGYYQATGSWEGVSQLFENGQLLEAGRGMKAGDADHHSMMDSRRMLFAITDLQGKILVGSGARPAGVRLLPRELRKGVALDVNGETVGYLVYLPDIERWRADTPEGSFLLGVNRAILISALAAAGFALLLGGVLARALTRSLRELTQATQALKSGQLGHQVEVRSQDELGVLAESFNQMSAELAQSTELRRRMTANIAHDLRSPLSVILGYTEALSDGKLEPNPEILSVMHTEAQHLNHLIDDLKTLSLADAGELPLIPQSVAPGVLLQRAADSHRVLADRKEISLATSFPADLPEIQVDVERMIQVLGNLMNNALRYTPAGGKITMSAQAVGKTVHLKVADSGVGISAEDLPYVFERSYRGDKARQQVEGGESGLGLAIAKSLVEAQGGQISVESQPSKGTTFTIEFLV